MANGKFRPGIPEDFSFDVEPVTDLGDYLTEPPPTPRPAKKVAERTVPPARAAEIPAPTTAIATMPPPRPVEPSMLTSAPIGGTSQASKAESETEDEGEERGGKAKAPRREISMTPETLRMSDELLEVIRSGSGQRDTKANELFHALVLLVHEAMSEIDAHSIPKRGRWGSPTARAYPLEIKNAFLRALLRKDGERGGDTIELRFPVESVA